MIRNAVLAGLGLTLIACRGSERAGPVATRVASDSLGRLPGPGSLSPDGTRLAYAQTVAGQSAIFVANADGSDPVQLTHGVWDSGPVWSPDGRWIAYHAESPSFDVLVVPADGGAPRPLTSGPATEIPRGWLPDGSGVVFSRSGAGDDATMVVPLDGGPPRRLAPAMPGDQHAALSPDGSRVAWDVHRGGTDATIWVQDLPDGAPRQLTTENYETAVPQFMWSPDGRSLVYMSRRTGTRDIYTVDVATGESRQLTTDIRDDYSPRWSPDGRWIAFLSDRGGQTDVWVVSAAGGSARRVTNDPAVEALTDWSADGTAIYFLRTQAETELQLVPTDSGPPRTLLTWSEHAIGDGDVSPDGGTVLFTSNRSGTPDIWSVPTSGGEPVVFAGSPLNDFGPEFSPDGSQVLFFSNRGGGTNLWVMPATGGEARQLTHGPSAEQSAEWSPDGSRIAFSSTRDAAGGDLWVIPAAGGEATRLTTGDLRPGFPQWSPDGRSIYFISRRPGGGFDGYRIAATGGAPLALGTHPAIGNWQLSPDGTQLSYSTFEGGWAFVNVMPSGGGASRRLTPGGDNAFQPFARWTPDGSRLIVVDLDLEANRDAQDLQSVRVADGVWRRLTRTRLADEALQVVTADGRQALVIARTTTRAIMKVPVAEPLAEGARP